MVVLHLGCYSLLPLLESRIEVLQVQMSLDRACKKNANLNSITSRKQHVSPVGCGRLASWLPKSEDCVCHLRCPRAFAGKSFLPIAQKASQTRGKGTVPN